jgi:glycosyltransferase involved in cell wall biosynthesis
MRVMLVSHRMPPDAVAGVERYTQSLASEMLERGDVVTVVTRRPGSDEQIPHIVDETLDPLRGGRLARLCGGESPRDQFHFGRVHRRLERLFEHVLVQAAPDVVHFNHIIDLSPRFLEIALRLRSAVVLSLHDFYFACPRIILKKSDGRLCDGPEGGRECFRCGCLPQGMPEYESTLRAMYYRRLLTVPQYVLCPSEYVARYFRRWGGVDPSRVLAVPNGIHVPGANGDMLPTPPIDGRPLRLAFMGSVVEHKGVHVILQAAALAGVPMRLDVFGPADPHYAKSLREQAAGLPNLELNLAGPYEPRQVRELLRDVDCLVAPSQWPETFLLVTREAMACGVPVIVSRLGALPDAVHEGENGFAFTHDRPEELAALFKRLAGEPGLLAKVSAGAAATKLLSVAGHADLLRDIYKRAMIDLSLRRREPSPADLDELREMYICLTRGSAMAGMN